MRISAENALLDAALQNPETAPFAQFTLDLRHAVDPQTREPLFPHLQGRMAPQPLWKITSNGGSQADRDREEQATQEREHERRVTMYAERVANGEGVFESPVEGDEDDDVTPTVEVDAAPQDEWDTFWCGESPTQRGYVSRARLNY